MKRWKMELKKIEERKGFILVDAMVAVLVLAIGLSALALLYTGGIGTLHKSSTREKAVQVAAERLELVKAKDGQTTAAITDIITKANANTKVTDSGETYTATMALGDKLKTKSEKENDAYLRLVTVTVTWNNPNAETMILYTYIATSDDPS